MDAFTLVMIIRLADREQRTRMHYALKRRYARSRYMHRADPRIKTVYCPRSFKVDAPLKAKREG